jgi:hypothetical protein
VNTEYQITERPPPPAPFVTSNKLVDSYAQPKSVHNDLPAIKDLVLSDIAERAEFGKNKYGTYLQPHNGRDVLADLYQELLDAVHYTRQLIYERDGK